MSQPHRLLLVIILKIGRIRVKIILKKR